MHSVLSNLLVPGLTKTTEDKVLKILRSQNRTEDDAIYLYHNMRMPNFFETFFTDEDGHIVKEWCLKCLMHLKYESYRTGEPILKQGDPSNGKVYIIYHGEVSIIVKEHDAISQINVNIEESSKKKNSFFSKNSNTSFKLGSKNTLDEFEDEENETNDARLSPIKKKPSQTSNNGREFNMDETVTKFKKALITGLFSPDIAKKATLKREKTVQAGLTQKEKEIASISLSKFKSKFKSQRILKKTTTILDNQIEDIAKQYGVVRDTISEGGYFGERALQLDSKRTATVMANCPVTVLSIHKNELDFIRHKFDAQKSRILNFLSDVFSDLKDISNADIKEALSYLCEERVYPSNSLIFDEADKGTKIYLIYSGTCEIYRNIWVDESDGMKYPMRDLKQFYKFTPVRSRKITLAHVSEGTILGEDILFKKDANYTYTAKVLSTTARIVAIKKSTFLLRFPFTIKDELKEISQLKMSNYNNIIMRELMRRNITLHNSDVSEHLIGKVTSNHFKSAIQKTVNPFTGALMDSPRNLETIQEFGTRKYSLNPVNKTPTDLKLKISHFSRKDFVNMEEKPKNRKINPFDPNEISNPVIRSHNLSISRTYDTQMDKYIDLSKHRNSEANLNSPKIPHLNFDEDDKEKRVRLMHISPSNSPTFDIENTSQTSRSHNISKIRNQAYFIKLGLSSPRENNNEKNSFMSSDYFSQPISARNNSEFNESGFQLRSLIPSKKEISTDNSSFFTKRETSIDKYINESLLGKKNIIKRRRIIPPLLSKQERLKKLGALDKLSKQNQDSEFPGL